MSFVNKILIAEDDRKTSELVERYLTNTGYLTAVVHDGKAALQSFLTFQPNLLILDVMLPYLDGFDVCGEIRKTSQVPILFLTARDEESDVVLGLGLGADDYVSKPFSPRELMARVKALLRRSFQPAKTVEQADQSQSGLFYDTTKRRFSLHGQSLELTPIEFTLLQTLMHVPGKVFLRSELLNKVYPDGEIVIDRVIDVHIGKLRQKLNDDPNQPVYIHTVRGLGYRFSDQESS